MDIYKVSLYIFSILYFNRVQQVFTIALDVPEFPLPVRLKTEESAFDHINALLNKYNPLNLGEGSPDYPPFKELQHALANVATSKDYSLSQYSPDSGHPRLLKVISKFYSKLLNRTLDPDKNILVTSGATEALFVTFLSHTFPGDEWIIFEPFYEPYVPIIRAANGVPRFIKLEPKVCETNNSRSADWTFDKEELSRLFNKKTKGVLINTPHNPLGKVFTLNELMFIADLAKKWKTLVVCDEVYQFLTFDNSKHIRISTLPGMFERTIMIGSGGKMFGVTGYRIGWVYGDTKLLNNLKAAHTLVVLSAPTPIQDAVAVVMEQEIKNLGTPHSFLELWRKQTEAKRDYLYRILLDFGMDPVLPEGGYFITANWTAISRRIILDTETQECNDYKFTKWLIKNVKVLGMPLSSFYKNTSECSGTDLIRFTMIKAYETYEKADKLFSRWKLRNEL